MCSGLRPPQYALPTPEVSPLEAAPRSLADYHAHYATHVSHAPTLAPSQEGRGTVSLPAEIVFSFR